jgi:hypothetical protein
MKTLKKVWSNLRKTQYEKTLESAENVYELERMLKDYSYVHNIKRWMN